MTIKAVLFDLDQTLIDFITMKIEACRSAIKEMRKKGLKINEKDGLRKLMETYFECGIESDIAFTRFLEGEIGKADPIILQAGIATYIKTKPKFLKPYPYVLETLEMLKFFNIKLGIVTDAPRNKGMARINAMNIAHYFDFIITFDDTGVTKKEELPMKLAMKKLNLYPEEILFVGDSFVRDIQPAKKLGMKTLHVKSCEDLKSVKGLLRYI
jgi:putative hydrolase of the HAD superfamily